MKEKVQEDSTMAAETPFMLYGGKLHENVLCIHPSQNELQSNINNFSSFIRGNLSGHWFWVFINVALAGFIGDRQCDMLPAPFQ